MTDATTQSAVSRWFLVLFTTLLGWAAIWLAAHLTPVDARSSSALIGSIVLGVVAIVVLVATYLSPSEVRQKVFGPLYAVLVIVAIMAISVVIASAGIALPPTFDFG